MEASEGPRPCWPLDFGLLGCREGNGNPLQCSCLESPVDRGAWWVAVHGVAQSRTHRSDAAAGAAGCRTGKE